MARQAPLGLSPKGTVGQRRQDKSWYGELRMGVAAQARHSPILISAGATKHDTDNRNDGGDDLNQMRHERCCKLNHPDRCQE